MDGADGFVAVDKQVWVCRKGLEIIVVEFYCLFQVVDSRCFQQTERGFVQFEGYVCWKVAFYRRFY